MSKLTENEQLVVRSFISGYQDLFEKIMKIEKKLESLDVVRKGVESDLIAANEEITQFRLKEVQYTQKLKEKYGEFKLNMETFEIEPS